MPYLKLYRIQIEGKDDSGPWKVRRLEGGLIYEEEGAQRFGELCLHIIKMVQSKPNEYGLEYLTPNGFLFEKTEERVLTYLLDVHNANIRRAGLLALV